jgi:hypothetical protein
VTTRAVSDEWWAGFHLGQADKEAGRYSLVGGDTQAAHDRTEGYAAGRGLAAAHASRDAEPEAGQ